MIYIEEDAPLLPTGGYMYPITLNNSYYARKEKERAGGTKKLVISIFLAALYIVSGTIMPLFNKEVFTKYPFPVTASLLQVIGATVVLLIYNLIVGFMVYKKIKSTPPPPVVPPTPPSPLPAYYYPPQPPPPPPVEEISNNWIFNRFFWKCWILLPVGICFAAVIAISNLGLSMVPVNIHVLLKTTNIIWVVLFA
jgi:hypothetical protein